MTIGFIGIGNMGRPMAENLLKKTGQLFVYDINDDAVRKLTDQGAEYLPLSKMAETCDIVFMMLPNGAISKSTLFSKDGLIQQPSDLKLVVDMSSVTASDSQECAKALAGKGIGFLDAPVSGGMPKAKDGTLSFMVGGKEEDFQRAKPYLEAMGTSVQRIGESGSGSVTKLANQVIVTALLGAVGEAYTMAAKAGAAPALVYEAIRGGLAQNTLMDMYLPKIWNRDFTPGGILALNLKDVNNIIQTAEKLQVEVPVTKTMAKIITSEELKDSQTEDHRAVVKYFEKKAGVVIQSDGLSEER